MAIYREVAPLALQLEREFLSVLSAKEKARRSTPRSLNCPSAWTAAQSLDPHFASATGSKIALACEPPWKIVWVAAL